MNLISLLCPCFNGESKIRFPVWFSFRTELGPLVHHVLNIWFLSPGLPDRQRNSTIPRNQHLRRKRRPRPPLFLVVPVRVALVLALAVLVFHGQRDHRGGRIPRAASAPLKAKLATGAEFSWFAFELETFRNNKKINMTLVNNRKHKYQYFLFIFLKTVTIQLCNL